MQFEQSNQVNARWVFRREVSRRYRPALNVIAVSYTHLDVYKRQVWHGAGSNTDLTEEAYEAITEEAAAAGLAPTYHVYSRRNLIVTDDVVWYQIPDRILSDFGLDVRTESFIEES